jgi:L-lysine 6-transaminase
MVTEPEDIHDIVRQFTIGDGEHIVIDYHKSIGSYIVDARSGQKYLDCSSQYASQALGWNHPGLKQWMDCKPLIQHKIANSDFYTDVYADFLKTFSGLTQDFQYLFFVEGGSLAVENAIKAAFDWKAQKLNLTEEEVDQLDIIHLQQAFHGRSGYCLSVTNTVPNKTARFPKFPWTRVVNPKITSNLEEVIQQEEKSIAQIKKALLSRKVAAILLEPIQGEGGDNHFRFEYLLELRKLADENDCLLIFDEVQTGIGLTGKMWAYQHFGIIPDLLVFGKKCQVCGFASTKRIDEVCGNVFHVSSRINSTWGGNLLDMYRFHHIAKIIHEQNLVANAAIVGDYFLKKLQKLTNITNARGRGLFLAFDLEDVKARDVMLSKLRKRMSILACGEKSIRIRPHLTFNKSNVDEAVSYINDAR